LVLHSGQLPAGEHSLVWNGKGSSGKAATSGMYFYRLESADGILTRKMVLLK
jgi:hypothetical protein